MQLPWLASRGVVAYDPVPRLRGRARPLDPEGMTRDRVAEGANVRPSPPILRGGRVVVRTHVCGAVLSEEMKTVETGTGSLIEFVSMTRNRHPMWWSMATQRLGEDPGECDE